MYAIIETGGKQYRVEKGNTLQIEKLPQEPGQDVDFANVLLIKAEENTPAKIGQPYVSGSKVSATILRHLRAKKILVFKRRAKKGYRKKQGHRQNLTEIKIKEISL